jgi:hypothetical protein
VGPPGTGPQETIRDEWAISGCGLITSVRESSRQKTPTGSWEGTVPLWLILVIVGVILAIVGFAGVGQILIWIGVAVLVVGLILSFTGRRGRV